MCLSSKALHKNNSMDISLRERSEHIYSRVMKGIERFQSRDQHLCKFMGTKESACIRKEFNSHRIGLEHQHGRRFIVLEH